MKYPEIQFEPFFSWVNRPRIMYSPGVRRELGYEMSQLGGSKVAIFTDEGLIKAGVAEMVAKEVRDSDLQLVGIFDKILQDARINNINEGRGVLQKNRRRRYGCGGWRKRYGYRQGS